MRRTVTVGRGVLLFFLVPILGAAFFFTCDCERHFEREPFGADIGARLEQAATGWTLDRIDQRLHESEAQSWDAALSKIRPQQEKQIYWAEPRRLRSRLSFVYIHGFSAGPLEFEPTIQKLAQRSKANLFVTRLKAHGLESGAAFKVVRAEEWLADTVEALAIGHAIGEKVVVVGMSTGASLALLATAAMTRVRNERGPDGLILLSPNFRLENFGADLLMPVWMAPLTDLVMRWVEGDEHEFKTQNELHRKRWTSRYPIEGAVQLLRVLRALSKLRLDSEPFSALPRLVLYTARDTVVSVSEIEKRVGEVRSARLTAVNWANGDQHQLASRTFSPEKVDELVNVIDRWVLRQSFSVGGRGN